MFHHVPPIFRSLTPVLGHFAPKKAVVEGATRSPSGEQTIPIRPQGQLKKWPPHRSKPKSPRAMRLQGGDEPTWKIQTLQEIMVHFLLGKFHLFDLFGGCMVQMVQEYGGFRTNQRRHGLPKSWETPTVFMLPQKLRMSRKNVQICGVHQAVVPRARSRLPQFTRFAKELPDCNLATLWSARRWKMSARLIQKNSALTWPEGFFAQCLPMIFR